MTSRVVSLSIVLLAVAGAAPAQTIPIQTVPLVPADQFDIFPSYTLGMGGVSIAVVDTLHDPFVNPAKGARIRAARFFSSPTLYHVSRDAGAGRTLPLGALGTAGSWFGGLALALQQVDASHPPSPSVSPPVPFAATADTSASSFVPSPANLSPAPDTHGNALAFALLGTTLPGLGSHSAAASAGPSYARSTVWTCSIRQRASHAIRRNGRCPARPSQGMGRRPLARSDCPAPAVPDDPRCDLPRHLLGSRYPAILPERAARAQPRCLQALGRTDQVRASATGAGMAHRLAGDRQSHVAA